MKDDSHICPFKCEATCQQLVSFTQMLEKCSLALFKGNKIHRPALLKPSTENVLLLYLSHIKN